MKKRISLIVSLILLLAFVVAMTASCQPTEEPKKEPETISIPDVTVDLRNPENRVDVPEDEKSEVYDSTGRRLSDSEWLLNSKFAKSYILSLGVGEYSFTFKSATKNGTIKLTVTDSESPDYVFLGEVAEKYTFRESPVLPLLVKNQDSYQGDYEVSYSLKNGEQAVAIEKADNGVITTELDSGNYTYTASLTRNGEQFNYTKSFYVQSFEEYLSENANKLFFGEVEGEFMSASDEGTYHVKSEGYYEITKYTLTQEILDKAITAGKTKITFTVVTKNSMVHPSNGSALWMTDSWNAFKIGFAGETDEFTDRLSESIPYLVSTEISTDAETGETIYTYTGTTLLTKGFFTTATPLQFWIAHKTVGEADVRITFD